MGENDCVFCKIIKGEIKVEKFLESANFIAIKDGNPQVEGHSLIIPKKHFENINFIPNELGSELLEFEKKVTDFLIKKNKFGTGFNLIANTGSVAGQVVMHAHIHIVPRKEGDGIRFLVKV